MNKKIIKPVGIIFKQGKSDKLFTKLYFIHYAKFTGMHQKIIKTGYFKQ